jgi:hypothetical protein
MRRRIALSGTTLCMLAVTALGAGPSTAGTPAGKGLVSFGTLTCDGIGEVELFGPRGVKANNGYLVVGEDVKQVTLTHLELTVTDLEGNVIDELSKSFGAKAPFTRFACTQEFEEPGIRGQLTVTLAFVPPR